MLGLLIPQEIPLAIGPLSLSGYRIVLLVLFFPMLFSLINLRVGRLRPSDGLVFLHGVWVILAFMSVHDGGIAIESGGIWLLETFGAYLLARRFIRSPKHFFAFVALMLGVLCVLAIPNIIGAVGHFQPFRDPLRIARGAGRYVTDSRLGMMRQTGPFAHQILNGVFCASALGMVWYATKARGKSFFGGTWRSMIVAVAMATSLSSGAFGAFFFQSLLLGWDLATRKLRHKWWVLMGIFAACYVLIDVLSNRTPFHVLISYLTFNPTTGYSRILIWTYGSAEALRHPVFGIGFNDWVRPVWMHSSSMDNFYLVLAVRHGIPAFAFFAAAVLYVMLRAATVRINDPVVRLARTGWMVSMGGMIIAACTVHYWNALVVYFCFMIGAGVWLLDYPAHEKRMRRNAMFREARARTHAAHQREQQLAAQAAEASKQLPTSTTG